MNTLLNTLETLAAQERQNAVNHVDALIQHLQAIRADLDSDKSIAWWEDGIDSRKASSAVSRAVNAQRMHDEAQRAHEFAVSKDVKARRVAH